MLITNLKFNKPDQKMESRRKFLWYPEQFKKYYDSNLEPGGVLTVLEEWKWEVIEREMKFDANDTVLDIGCGYGRMSKRIAPKVKLIVGLDQNEANLTFAKTFINMPNFETMCFDIGKGRLPFGDATVDKIVAENIIMFLSNKECAVLFREFDRILAPSGIIEFNYLNLFYLLIMAEVGLENLYKLAGKWKGRRHFLSQHFVNSHFAKSDFRLKTYGETFYYPIRIRKHLLIPRFLDPIYIRIDRSSRESQFKFLMRSLFCIVTRRGTED